MAKEMIFVAEDEQDIQKVIKVTLKYKGGFEVKFAGNGLELLDLVKEEKPALIICDVMMPRMDGYEACRTLKAQPDTASIPFVFLTAKAQEKEIEEGLALGAIDYIKKPFEPDEFVAKVKGLLGNASRKE
ncbi:MAG: response regulator [Candidatus Eremiobacteraeota bacterium]|nr:response regulator [Candidatus Eremiobacteraeota bacterium]